MNAIPLCASSDITDGGDAWPFEVLERGYPCRAFVVRFEGQLHAWLNRCTHVAMELDLMPNRVFDASGQWLICSSHGALFDPASGACAGGPCQGGLQAVQVIEQDGQVFWLPDADIQPAG